MMAKVPAMGDYLQGNAFQQIICVIAELVVHIGVHRNDARDGNLLQRGGTAGPSILQMPALAEDGPRPELAHD